MAKIPSPATLLIKDRIISPIKEFIHDSRAVGITLIVCTIFSIIISNSQWAEGYLHFWEKIILNPPSGVNVPHSILHIINDGLMTIFFFLVGLEIKRELLVGELSSVRKSMLPIIAAAGGMAVPALIYLLWNNGTDFSKGWGIPMATDIAFSLAVLSLLGKRAPLSLRIFLTALAIIDDLGGILTIAIFYASEIKWNYIFLSTGILFVLGLMNVFQIKRYFIYIFFGIFLWYFVFNSGVHATIAGVLLAMTVPLHKINQLEHQLHDPVNFIIMPLFALANTAIILPSSFSFILTSSVSHGISLGLVLGKPIGIFLFSLLSVKLKIAERPTGMSWKHLWGVGMVAGIGFTMSIFMATLAFDLPGIQLVAKLAIITASLVAGTAGYFYLRLINKRSIPT
jgi:Na+:H+ antiporter, NhaA family